MIYKAVILLFGLIVLFPFITWYVYTYWNATMTDANARLQDSLFGGAVFSAIITGALQILAAILFR